MSVMGSTGFLEEMGEKSSSVKELLEVVMEVVVEVIVEVVLE
jgi:hypothetical protein